MSRIARAVIDLGALKHNIAIVRQYAPAQKIMAVVKADAYGHGVARVAKSLDEILNDDDAFAVASIDEAIMLRSVGISRGITVLEGFSSVADLALMQEHNITSIVHHISQVILLELHQEQARNLKLWLKIDSGMHRLGFAPVDVKKMYKRLLTTGVDTDIGLMTHFANADDLDDNKTENQVNVFNNIAEGNPADTSLANSAAILGWPDALGSWVRPGIMLYGANPFVKREKDYKLKPVMTLVAALIAINKVAEGESIGYGGKWTCPEDMLVGVVSIGYGDGYPRHAPNGTPVLVNEQRVPLIGRVSMDKIMVDLREQADAKVGDKVVLWGEGLPVEEIAEAAETISYELLCGVTKRVTFEYHDGETG